MNDKLFHKNFVLLLSGQAISLFGNCILDFALSMYVLEVTGSAAVFAGFLAVAMLPTILLSPLGGVLADRVNRRNVMVFLDFSAGLVVLAAALLLGNGNDLLIICLTLIIQSVLGAFEMPTVQACVPQMQKGDNLIRGNAVVNQINAIAAFVAPFIGSLFYTAFGLKPVMYAGVVFFLLTAFLERFIQLDYCPQELTGGVLSTIKSDLLDGARFIGRDKKAILHILLLVALIAFVIQGIALVGLPFIVRNVLGLSANYYGATVSILGLAAIVGSILAGLIVTRLPISKLYLTLAVIGLFLLPVGGVFLLTESVYLRYAVLLASFVVIQITASIFSIFALTVIQQLTPNHLLGKVMAFTATFTLCAQPLGQIVYGVLFDNLANQIYFILLPAGIILALIGIMSKSFFAGAAGQLPATGLSELPAEQ